MTHKNKLATDFTESTDKEISKQCLP